jgi:acetylornithine/succinyldiaminopimelate/putrescine aminotransferase/predicted amino acid dehydrogenase
MSVVVALRPEAPRRSTDALSDLYRRNCRPRVGELLQALRLDVVFHRAEGNKLWHRGADGHEVEVTDFLGGFGALVLGHNHPALVATARRLLDEKVPFLAQMSCRAGAAQLGEKLREMMLARTGRRYITTLASTGAEGIEAAMKHALYAYVRRTNRLAAEVEDEISAIRAGLRERRYSLAAGFHEQARAALSLRDEDHLDHVLSAMRAHNHRALGEAPTFVALERAFHGKTLGAVALTHYAEYRRHFAASAPRTIFVESGSERSLDAAIERATVPYYRLAVAPDNTVSLVIARRGTVAAMFVEPIQGEGGIRVVPRVFLRRCRALADERGFPLIFDEIQCGMGRTGTWLFSEQQEVVADYYVLSKGLGGGLAKVAALLVAEAHYERELGILHTSTFAEDEHGSAIALATLELLDQRPELMQNAAERGRQLKLGLLEIQRDFPEIVKDVRGAGLLLGLEFHDQTGRGAPVIAAVFAQDLLSYVISGYLLHEHRLRVAPCMSNKALIRVEPSLLVTTEECDELLGALRRVCEIIARQNSYELLRFAVGRPRGDDDTPMASFAAPTRTPPSTAVAARVAFIGYFVEASHLRRWDPSLALFTEAELADLLRRMYSVVDPLVIDEKIIEAPSGRRVGLTVIGIPIDSTTFDAMMRDHGREELLEKVRQAVDLAADVGCSVAALGGFTSIVAGNGRALHTDRIAITTGNALTAAMGLEALRHAASEAGIELATARFAALGAGGNIGSIYSQVLADEVARLILVGRPGRERELEALAARIYADAALTVAAHRRRGDSSSLGGVAGVIADTQAVASYLAARGVEDAERRLYQALRAELADREPISITADLGAIRSANLILGASNSPVPLLHSSLLGADPIVICDVAIPSDVDPSVRVRADVTVVDGGLVRLPLDTRMNLRGFDLPAGHIYACCCEAVIMGLAGVRENYSYGTITKAQVTEIGQMARVHGFTLGERGRPPMRAVRRAVEQPERPLVALSAAGGAR